MDPAPMMPSPPAFDTADASFHPDTHTIPAWMMGWRIEKSSVTRVVIPDSVRVDRMLDVLFVVRSEEREFVEGHSGS